MTTPKKEPHYTFTSTGYDKKINTPSISPKYFDEILAPHIQTAMENAKKEERKARILDLACGHANGVKRVETLPGYEDLQIYGVDLSTGTLAEARSTFKTEHPNIDVTFVAANAENQLENPKPNSIDVGIAINALAYKQGHMLKTMFNALKPGGTCVINFFIPNKNKPYIDCHISNGCTLQKRELNVSANGRSEIFELLVTDLGQHKDIKLRKLGQQSFLQSTEDIERLAALIGLTTEKTTEFEFPSAAINNEIVHNDVYTFKKPEPKDITLQTLSIQEKILATLPV